MYRSAWSLIQSTLNHILHLNLTPVHSLPMPGFTISFRVRVDHYRDDMVLFSNGGEREDAYGMVVLYKLGQLHIVVRTMTLEWTTAIPPPPANK